jgi:hypothetical protein
MAGRGQDQSRQEPCRTSTNLTSCRPQAGRVLTPGGACPVTVGPPIGRAGKHAPVAFGRCPAAEGASRCVSLLGKPTRTGPWRGQRI